MSLVTVVRAGPLTTIQDGGRPGLLAHGVTASGPMDARAFAQAGGLAGNANGAAIEFGPLGLDLVYSGLPLAAGIAGGQFNVVLNAHAVDMPAPLILHEGDRLAISTGPSGNFGYLRFAAEVDVPLILGSRSTNASVGLGGFEGRALRDGDVLPLIEADASPVDEKIAAAPWPDHGPIRFVWGLHADLFSPTIRSQFAAQPFQVTSGMDRMGVRLADPHAVFGSEIALDLVSDAIVPGDIQILGDGTPVVLMRDHQPTGGYPRIATIISPDLDRFAQMRPGTEFRFKPVTVDHAHTIARQAR